MKKVIVTGGRDYDDFSMVQDVLDFLNPSVIIQGGCFGGADVLAAEYAKQEKIECITYKAKWNKHGKKAGPIRNEEMVKDNPDAIVVAFPGGRGTENCVKWAKACGNIVLRVEE